MAKEIREDNKGRILSFPVTAEERKKIKNGDIDFVNEQYSLKCHHGVWDEGIIPGKENRLNNINETKRKGKCFFYPYNPGMLFKASEELQRSEQEYEHLKRSNLYTRIGLWIAAISLFFSAIVWIISS